MVDLSNIKRGDVVMVVWTGTLFDPDAYIRPGNATPDPESITSVGFISELTSAKLSISLDAMYEAGNTEPSFRAATAIPTSIISACTKLGSLASPA